MRRNSVCSNIEWLKDRHGWPGLEAVVMTEYMCEIKGESTTIRRFYISSFADRPEKMAQCIRNHWQVEKCLHWVLDVTFRQDDCRIRKANAAANFATINHAVINLLKRISDKKMSLPQKRRSSALDDDIHGGHYPAVVLKRLPYRSQPEGLSTAAARKPSCRHNWPSTCTAWHSIYRASGIAPKPSLPPHTPAGSRLSSFR